MDLTLFCSFVLRLLLHFQKKKKKSFFLELQCPSLWHFYDWIFFHTCFSSFTIGHEIIILLEYQCGTIFLTNVNIYLVHVHAFISTSSCTVEEYSLSLIRFCTLWEEFLILFFNFIIINIYFVSNKKNGKENPQWSFFSS